jgi:hypothetical protein
MKEFAIRVAADVTVAGSQAGAMFWFSKEGEIDSSSTSSTKR